MPIRCSFVALLLACSQSSSPAVEPVPIEPLEVQVELNIPVHIPLPTVETSMSRCLLGGGALTIVDAVNNNDTGEHGEVFAFDTGPDGLIAAATEDGVIKLWTLEGFVGSLSPARLTYGPEFARTPSTDIAFLDSYVVAGDRRGLVTSNAAFGIFSVVGGTTPETPITAVATDEASGRVAHADTALGGNVMIRGIDDGAVRGPLAVDAEAVVDLAFDEEGRLFVASDDRLERWGAGELAESAWSAETELREIAVSGSLVAAIGPRFLHLLSNDLIERARVDAQSHGGRSVSVLDGEIALTVGAEGALRAWSVDGVEIAQLAVEDPIAVRAGEEVVFVASRNGMLHAVACVP